MFEQFWTPEKQTPLLLDLFYICKLLKEFKTYSVTSKKEAINNNLICCVNMTIIAYGINLPATAVVQPSLI